MKKQAQYLESIKPKFSIDNEKIPETENSRLNVIARIEQYNHVIPIHRTKLDHTFIPIVWNESLDYHYELVKTMYQPTYLELN